MWDILSVKKGPSISSVVKRATSNWGGGVHTSSIEKGHCLQVLLTKNACLLNFLLLYHLQYKIFTNKVLQITLCAQCRLTIRNHQTVLLHIFHPQSKEDILLQVTKDLSASTKQVCLQHYVHKLIYINFIVSILISLIYHTFDILISNLISKEYTSFL